MRIVYGIPGSSIGGGVNVVLEHASRLMARGHDVIILNLIGELNTSWNPIYRFSALSRYNDEHIRYLRSLEVDIIVCTGWQTVYELGRLNLTARAFVYFLQADEAAFSPQGSLDRDLAAATRSLDFCYVTCANWLRQIAYDKVQALPVINGVNRSIFFPDRPLIRKGIRLRVLIEGPIAQPRKRILDAFLACEPFRSDIDLWCVSSGGEPHAWFKPDLYLSRVPMTAMRRIYSACDVIVKLSSSEGMFGPPLEMMACGGTAITSDCLGHEEYMVDQVNGLVVPIGDIAAAQSALGRLIKEPLTLERLKKEGLATSLRFNWNSAVSSIEEAFSRFADGKQPLPMKAYLASRGTPLRSELMRSYKDKSYGTLPRPATLAKGFLTLSKNAQRASGAAFRIRGWVCHEGLATTQTSISLSGFDGCPRVFPCSIDRPDVYPSSPGSTILPGFDILYLLDGSLGGHVPVRLRFDVIRKKDNHCEHLGSIKTGLPAVQDFIILEVEETEIEHTDITSLVEHVEHYGIIHLTLPLIRDPDQSISLRIFAYCRNSEGYIFYQKASTSTFKNAGLRLSPSDEILDLDLKIDDDGDGERRYIFAYTPNVEVDCIRMEVI